MAIDYTTSELVKMVKDDSLIPESQTLYSDDDIISILSRELLSDIVPLIMKVNQEYFVTNYDRNIDTSVNHYRIPTRAVGIKLRDFVLLNTSGYEVSFPRLEPEVVKSIYGVYNATPGFLFQNDEVLIFPNTSNLGVYRMRFKIFRRPNNLVSILNAAQITAIDHDAKTITVGVSPSDWTIDTTFDLINGQPPFNTWGDDLAITNISGNVFTFSTLPTEVSVGDWMCAAGTSPIAQIPYECFPLLAQRAIIKILMGLGDDGLNAAIDIYKDMVSKFEVMVSPRADGSPQKFNPTNSLFRSVRPYFPGMRF